MNIRWRDYEGYRVPYLKGEAHHSCDRFHQQLVEVFTNSQLRELIEPGDTVVDLGAHIGQQTYIMLNAVGEKGRVIAFEPDLEHAAILTYGLTLNRITNVYVFAAAADDRTAYNDFPFLMCGEGSAEIDHRGLKGKAWCMRLDDMKIKIDGIKCDTQGRETFIFDGARESLQECKFALVEYHDRQADYRPFIVGMGFKHAQRFQQPGASLMDLFLRE